ncbi:hypothetical protein SBA4_4270004 [Candidatus Sulfopaludibacter sp. SbA4]|nr:hypothetical protein SBA4_4270004 [Candidatus Sulfopaludibacter sp. SbA4]
MDLLELLRRPEGKTVEYKRDLSSPEGVSKTLVSFANTAGGALAIGIENATRRVLGCLKSWPPKSAWPTSCRIPFARAWYSTSRSCPGGRSRCWWRRSTPAVRAPTTWRGSDLKRAFSSGSARPTAAPTRPRSRRCAASPIKAPSTSSPSRN